MLGGSTLHCEDMKPKPNNRMVPLAVVEDVEPLRKFYTEILGFEESTYLSAEGGGAFVDFRYNSFPVGFSTPDALPGLPAGLTTNLMVVFEVQELASIRDVMARRGGEVIGALLSAPWGEYFDVIDPVGTIVRFIQTAGGPEPGDD